MILKLLVGAFVLVVLFLTYIAFMPSELKIVRELRIAAPAEAVFAHMLDLRKANAWNPFVGLDPNAKQVYSNPTTGPGAFYEWDGSNQVGAGRTEIIEVQAPVFVRLRLTFHRPFPGESIAEYRVRPDGNGCVASWSYEGRPSFIPRLLGIFLNMEKMMGRAFSDGLVKLKAIVESEKR